MRMLAFVLLAVGLSALGGSARQLPTFDGTWSLDATRSTYPNDQGDPFTVYVFNQFFTIRQTRDTLAIQMEPMLGGTRNDDDCALKIVYRLDGTPTEDTTTR